MNEKGGAPSFEPARLATNCRACARPIAHGERALRRPRTGALSCATCAPAELQPRPWGHERPDAA